MSSSNPIHRAIRTLASTSFWKFHAMVWLAILCFAIPTRIFRTDDLSWGLWSAILSQTFGFFLTFAARFLFLHLLQRHMLIVYILLASALGHIGGFMDVLITNAAMTYFPGHDAIDPFGIYFLTRSRLYLFWSAIYGAYVYRDFAIRSERDIAEKKANIHQLETLVRAAETRMLRAQVSPHFLFNALTVAIADLKRRPDVVSEMLSAMAAYFRYAQINRERSDVPLGEEFDAILQYLIVQKACMREQLILSTCICEAARRTMVPGLLLQPLVENALLHGKRTDESPLHITINIRQIGGHLRISVANSGDWFERNAPRGADDPGGSGLPNLRSRLSLAYGEAASLTIVANADLVEVTILLPARDPVPAAGAS